MHFKVLFARSAVLRRRSFTKTLLVMQLTSILLLCACLQVSASGYSQTVSFSGKKVPLERVFATVEKQTGYVFFFDEELLRDARPVTITAENVPLEQFLQKLLADQPFRYLFQKRTIVISRKPPELLAPPADTSAPPVKLISVNGAVYGEGNQPLSGASVTTKSTGKSIITNVRGQFQLTGLPQNTVLVFSFIGYGSREVTVQESSPGIIVRLPLAVSMLDEEVVKGYGRTSMRFATGNTVKISGEDINRQPVMNPLLALEGRVPGMTITATQGYANSPVKVEIRGRNTFNPNLISDPLYVIDGVPLVVLDAQNTTTNASYERGSPGFVQAGLSTITGGQSPLFSINPRDIESITVLKDADATAIYGARGANGVILITTKNGKPGKTRLGLDFRQVFSRSPKYYDMLNTEQYLSMRREALRNDGLGLTTATAPDIISFDNNRYTDWQREIWGTGKTSTIGISLSGGDDRTSFRVGTTIDQSREILTLKGSTQRLNITLGLNHRSQDQKLKLSFSATYGYSKVDAISSPGVTTLAPNAPPIYGNDGKLNYKDWNAAGIGSRFPFRNIYDPLETNTNFLNAGMGMTYQLLKGLDISFRAGYSQALGSNNSFQSIASQNPINNPQGGALFGSTKLNNWNLDPELVYTRYISNGRLEILLGGTLQNSVMSSQLIQGLGYTNDALLSSISLAPFTVNIDDFNQVKYMDLHARLNYIWANKYILNLTGNRSGSSTFGPGRQFGNFWSVGLGWILTEEHWIRRQLPDFISNFKINANYGIVGSQGGGAYQYLSRWSVPNPGMVLPNYNNVTPLAPLQAVNQIYQWAESNNLSADLSLYFLKDRINVSVSYYRNSCDNQITGIPTPAFTGFTTVTGNSPANVRNTGWEFSVSGQLVQQKNFRWSASFNLGFNDNKLISYPDFQYSSLYNTYRIGQSLNTRYVYKYLGINPQTGQRSYVDYNHDGAITMNSNTPPASGVDDRFIMLDLNDKFNGGGSMRFSYKSLDLNLGFSYRKGIGLIPFVASGGPIGNMPFEDYNGRWQKPGDNALYPRLSTLSANSDTWFRNSTGAYTDVSFFRLNTVSLSYQLPQKMISKAGMQSCSFSLTVQNIFTITGYKGLDPGRSFSSLPTPRSIAAGINLNF
ncbi:MAG TPA: SusC/RagA family TonB-linked outer membrane protein [Pseudobacter sp.]|nr:SusC/RagA family TonB-linked outer membrane protein [Pseudobacter sp.]